ncbi:MAG TPA: DUF624 domain-containing protein [Candidatus Avimonoglobus intestinipullorum]|uniref:DUF624 domain-containing protein n=1 Tax=Candidatus Avimonoglobus intestinipullorum TaxID=2840699 RepID=A0A9D1S6K0_9FIRM|nr:DUF624 domain-containing protein [Candidatus Avimonoglobus intestinipullorum]
MGLFGFNYSKPGPGVDKDAPKKKGIFLYFELFFRKFWKLIQANMLYFLASLPLLVIFAVFAPFPAGSIVSALYAEEELTPELAANIEIMFRLFFSVAAVGLCGSGPASASFAYILRCFTREQHSWIWTDFKEKFKENFKQGMIVTIVNVVVLYAGFTAIQFYYSMHINNVYEMGTLWLFLMALMCVLLVIFVFMHFYIYQLMVTFENKTVQLYKNALIFALAFLPMNVLFAGLFIVLTFIVFTTLTPPFAILIAFLLWMGIVRFPIEFYAARTIQRKILDQQPLSTQNRSEE